MSDARFSAFAPLALAAFALLSSSPACPRSVVDAASAPPAPAGTVTLRMDPQAPADAVVPPSAPAAAAAEAAALPPPTSANAPTGAATNASDDVIRDAHDAFLHHDSEKLALLRATALANHLPLAPWVDYWELTNRLSEASSDEVEQFYARWPDTYVEDRLRNDWLLEAGHRHDWDAFQRDYPRFRMNDDRSVTCYATLVEHLAGKPVHDAALARWLAIKDIDGGCQLMAQTLYDDKVFTDADVWQRMRRAAELPARSARRALRGAAQILGEPAFKEMSALVDDPARFIARRSRIAAARRSDMVTIALARLAAHDPAAAALQLQRRWQSSIGAHNAAWAWAEIARHGAQSLLPEAVDWADRAWAARRPRKGAKLGPPGWSDDVLGWHARAALRAGSGPQRWKDVLRAIDAMSASERAHDSWTYWHAQATLSLGLARPAAGGEPAIAEARRQLTALSDKLSFYGLLAAEDLGVPFVLPAPPVPLTPLERGLAHANPGLQRALALTALDLRDEGRREWNYTLRGMGDRDLLAAAQWACDVSDWQLCINTSERTKVEVDIAQRYPLPFRRDIVEAATDAGLDPAFVFGLIRQETRFMGNLRSAVGANGLMQLMPATAKWAAKKASIPYRAGLIADASTNLRIGSFYLKLVLDSFGGSDPMAAAAYNAGPARPRRWRGGMMLAPEVWTENVPFNETRDYVKKVLTNAAIYAALLGHTRPLLRPRLGPQIGPRDATLPPAPDLP